ncbi:HAAS signaling domain-containing protein [Hyphobacterium sp.]|uniref:HAAS signaling domain-containing protein n=1 Tax=Hyphobacterium sp. TaxID=2004662 RepID=UPI003B5180EC
MTDTSSKIEAYLGNFRKALGAFDYDDREGLTGDVREHIEEAVASGQSADAVLRALGPAHTLAKAYAIELELSGRGERAAGWFTQAARVFGYLAVGSILTLTIGVALASFGFALTLSGVAMLVIGMTEAVGVHLPGVQMNGVEPVYVIAAAPIVFILGVLSLWGLHGYCRWLIRELRNLIPVRLVA